jgi:signal transduction histidine kinase
MNGTPSIRWRLIGALAGVSLFTLVVVGVVFFLFLGGYVVERQKDLLLDQAVEVAEQIESVSASLPNGAGGVRVMNALLRSDLRVMPAGSGIAVFKGSTVVAKVGTVRARGGNLDQLRAQAEELGGEQPASTVIRSVGDAGGRKVDILLAAAPIELSDGTRGVAAVTLARSDAFTYRGGVMRSLLIAGVIAIALAILVGWALGAWMARPLRRLSSAARGIARGSYAQPVTGSYPGEVRELADSLETMRQEVRRSEDSLRGFVASAAHELRTPLTSIQGFSQALLDGTADTLEQRSRSAAAIYRESTRLRRLVDALLTLSRYDSHEFEPTMTTVAVDSLVNEEVERLVQAGLAEPGRIEVRAEADAHIVTDSDMLRQAVANLLHNAVQYGGADPVTVRIWRSERGLLLEVANGGEGLSAEDRTKIFSRFYRGRASRQTEGFGLGLALVWEICGLLEGKVQLVEGGPPTRFRVELPIEPGESARKRDAQAGRGGQGAP